MKLKHWIKIGVFCLIAVLIVLFASKLLSVANEKDDVGVYGFFLEPKDSLDVVMIGSSTLYSYFYSPLAYAQQGFTSYSLATSTMTAPIYRYAAEIAIEEQHPQLLVFETYNFCYDIQQDETSLRKFIDALPDSEIRRRAIADIVPEDLQDSFYNTFQKYHSSWTRLGELIQVMQDKADMNRKGYSITKNYATTPAIYEYVPRPGKYYISEPGLYYLEILLEYLKEADIENVLFVRFPETVVYEENEAYGQMISMIREAGFDFVNLEAAVDDIGLDMTTDFYNSTHLNIFGAEKFTSFFANYLMQRYNLKTDHTLEVEKEWLDCASYNDKILTNLEYLTAKNANGYLFTQRDFLEDYISENVQKSAKKAETGGEE